MAGGIIYRKKIVCAFFNTVVFRVIVLFLFVLMIIWMSLHTYTDTEAEFRIIILNKLEHVQLADELRDWQWNIEGFEYFSNLRDSGLRLPKKLPKSTGPSNGIWVLRKSGADNHIRLTNFQYAIPKKVLMGLRYFISGSGKIVIMFRDAISVEPESVALVQDESATAKKSQGFCSKIITPGHARSIDMIEIRAYPSTPTSFIIIDKVVVTVADGDSSRSLMYSFIPNQWCEDPLTQ